MMSSEEHKVTYGDGNVGDQKGHSCSSADDKETCGISHLFKLLVCVLCGMIFGTALNKAHGRWMLYFNSLLAVILVYLTV